MKIILYLFVGLFVLSFIGALLEEAAAYILPTLLIVGAIFALFKYPVVILIIVAVILGIYFVGAVLDGCMSGFSLSNRRKRKADRTQAKKEKKEQEKQRQAELSKRQETVKTLPDDAKKCVHLGQQYIDTYASYMKEIGNDGICTSLNQIIDLINKIINAIIRNPEDANDLRRIFDYYLLTTDKILAAYIRYQKEGVTGEHIDNTKIEIENSLSDVLGALEKSLDQLYRDDSMDISSEIYAMRQKMKMDGLS